MLDEWPGEKGRSEQKVPSKISYGTENGLGIDRWGYQVSVGTASYTWFKLKLDAHTKPTDFDNPLLQRAVDSSMALLPVGKTAMEVVTDYLGFLRAYFQGKLRESMVGAPPEQAPCLIVATIPATWSASAREATRQAVRNAGFASRAGDEIMMIDEPEAATLAVISFMENSNIAQILKVSASTMRARS